MRFSEGVLAAARGRQERGGGVQIGIVIALVSGVLALGLVVGLVAWIRRLRAEVNRLVTERYGAAAVLMDDVASSFGVESRGAAQLRGNGCLVATRAELVFVQWVPRRELAIPRSAIVAVETPRWHLGKSRGVSLLKVVFEEDGRRDSVAWQVRNLDAWRNELDPARR